MLTPFVSTFIHFGLQSLKKSNVCVMPSQNCNAILRKEGEERISAETGQPVVTWRPAEETIEKMIRLFKRIKIYCAERLQLE